MFLILSSVNKTAQLHKLRTRRERGKKEDDLDSIHFINKWARKKIGEKNESSNRIGLSACALALSGFLYGAFAAGSAWFVPTIATRGRMYIARVRFEFLQDSRGCIQLPACLPASILDERTSEASYREDERRQTENRSSYPSKFDDSRRWSSRGGKRPPPSCPPGSPFSILGSLRASSPPALLFFLLFLLFLLPLLFSPLPPRLLRLSPAGTLRSSYHNRRHPSCITCHFVPRRILSPRHDNRARNRRRTDDADDAQRMVRYCQVLSRNFSLARLRSAKIIAKEKSAGSLFLRFYHIIVIFQDLIKII